MQLLVDLRLIQDVCAGGRSQALAAPGASTADDAPVLALLGELLSKVQAAVDPFDYDVYEPYLKATRGALYQRLSLLLGHFTSLQPQHQQVRVNLSSTDQANTMAVAPTAPRFATLPIGTSTLHAEMEPGPVDALKRQLGLGWV